MNSAVSFLCETTENKNWNSCKFRTNRSSSSSLQRLPSHRHSIWLHWPMEHHWSVAQPLHTLPHTIMHQRWLLPWSMPLPSRLATIREFPPSMESLMHCLQSLLCQLLLSFTHIMQVWWHQPWLPLWLHPSTHPLQQLRSHTELDSFDPMVWLPILLPSDSSSDFSRHDDSRNATDLFSKHMVVSLIPLAHSSSWLDFHVLDSLFWPEIDRV